MSQRADEMNDEVFQLVVRSILDGNALIDDLTATSLALDIIRDLNEAGWEIEKTGRTSR